MDRAARRRQERKQSRQSAPAAAAAETSGVSAPASRRHWWLLVPLVLLGVFAYANSFEGAFVLDDFRKIVENTRLRQFSGALWRDRPLVELTLAINYAVSELEVGSYHAVNLLIHLLAGATLYALVHATLGLARWRERFAAARAPLAFAVAAIWLVHPLQTQSVTYIIQRGESMMGLFYLLTMLAVLKTATAGRPRGWFATAVVACGLGMLSKAVMVTAPVVAFLFDGLVVTRSFGETIRRRWTLYASLCATWVLLGTTGVLQSILGAGPATRTTTAGFRLEQFSGFEYLCTQPGVLVHYLKLAFWPHPLCLDYDWPIARSAASIVLPGIVIVALLLLTAVGIWRRWALAFLGVWFFLILGPTSSFIPIQDVAFEHRMYLPLAAIIALVVLGSYLIGRRLADAGRLPAGGLRAAGIAVVFVAIGLGLFGTVRRNRDYHTEQRMWATVLALRPNHARAHTQYAKTLEMQDRDEEAIAHYEAALAIREQSDVTHTNLGKTLVKLGRYEEAVPHYRRAIELNPGYFLAHNNLGNVLVTMRRYDQAIVHLKQASSLRPADPMVFSNLGRAYGEQGNTTEAIRALERALQIDPGYHAGRNNLAAALLSEGRREEAIPHLLTVLQSDPANANAMQNLTVALLESGDIDAAAAPYAGRAGIDLAHAQAHV
ncbi:MAG: tetratricopeptide repeat protein, partial [Phycisphaerales bacterium]|nr:tetratricopeptide repeat protein [Phycisphaerales bacterium]